MTSRSNDNFEKKTGRDVFFKMMEKELQDITDPATKEIKADLLETICCPLCDGTHAETLLKKQGFSYVRCINCGIIFVNPRLKERILVGAYTEESAADRLWKDILLSPAQMEFNDKNYGEILDVIQTRQFNGKLLDVGCSFGHFLDLARSRGFIVEGVELENEAVKYAREKFKLKIEQKVLAEASYPPANFDVAAALGVLEHVPNPLQFLEQINYILKPGGLLALTTPNVESLVCMILKEKARTFTGRNHLTLFSIKTLTAMLGKAGFAVVWCETYVSGINSLANHLQYLDPFSDVDYKYLPKPVTEILRAQDMRKELEQKICAAGLGYKLKLVAIKL